MKTSAICSGLLVILVTLKKLMNSSENMEKKQYSPWLFLGTTGNEEILETVQYSDKG